MESGRESASVFLPRRLGIYIGERVEGERVELLKQNANSPRPHTIHETRRRQKNMRFFALFPSFGRFFARSIAGLRVPIESLRNR